MVSTDTVVKDSSLQVDNDEGPDDWARAPLIPAQWRTEEGTPCECQVEAQAPHIVSLTRGDGDLMIRCQGWKSRLSPWPSLTLPSPLLDLGGLITALQMWRSDSPLGLCWHCRATAFPVVFAWSTKIIIALSWTLSWSFGEREQASIWTFAVSVEVSRLPIFTSEDPKAPSQSAFFSSYVYFLYNVQEF